MRDFVDRERGPLIVVLLAVSVVGAALVVLLHQSTLSPLGLIAIGAFVALSFVALDY